jgi:hypothetical protein
MQFQISRKTVAGTTYKIIITFLHPDSTTPFWFICSMHARRIKMDVLKIKPKLV